MNFEEWCKKYQGMTRDEFMNDISDMALKILEEKFEKFRKENGTT